MSKITNFAKLKLNFLNSPSKDALISLITLFTNRICYFTFTGIPNSVFLLNHYIFRCRLIMLSTTENSDVLSPKNLLLSCNPWDK